MDTENRQWEVRQIISASYGALDAVKGPLSFDDFYREYTEALQRNSEHFEKRPEKGLHEITASPTVNDPNEATGMGEGWRAFKDVLNPDDEFYYYRTGVGSWEELRGSEGYVLIRGHSIVRDFPVSMN